MNNQGFDSKKTFLMRLFVLAVCVTNIALVYLLYTKIKGKTVIDRTYEDNVKKYIEEYNKKQEYFQNYSFFESYDTIVLQNAKLNQAYKDSVNDFCNITQQEFINLFGIVRQITTNKNYGQVNRFGFNYTDWTRKEVVLRDQRGFNTSFIYSALTTIQYRINKNKNGTWINLSAQEIIDCCAACMKSKRPESVFDYIIKYGVSTEQEYPYENSRFDTVPKKCRRQQKKGKKYFIEDYMSVKNCPALEKAIKIGPVVVGLDGRNFPSYQYSIFTDCQRKTTHYAALVGISYDHYKLQNSWGRKWGERGFIRVSAGDSCGICLRGSYPIMKEQ